MRAPNVELRARRRAEATLEALEGETKRIGGPRNARFALNINFANPRLHLNPKHAGAA